jgi:Fe-S oxidoreductase
VTQTAALQRTIQGCSLCPRLCHHVCPAAHGAGSEEGTAWGLMTIVAAIGEGLLPASQETAEALYRCTDCGRCTAFCKHGNEVGAVLTAARAEAVSSGHAPEAVAALELELEGIRSDEEQARADHLRARHAAEGATAFLAAAHWLESDESAERLGQLMLLLNAVAGTPVGLLFEGSDGCCGGAARRAGFVELADRQGSELTELAGARSLLIVDCPDAAAALGAKALHLTRFLADRADAITATCAELKPATINLHGGCRERRVINLTNDELRLLAAVGLTAEPLLDLRGEPECCGGEAIYAAVWPDDAARAGRSLVKRTLGCNPTATSNARCAGHLRRSGADATFAVIDWVLARRAGQETP